MNCAPFFSVCLHVSTLPKIHLDCLWLMKFTTREGPVGTSFDQNSCNNGLVALCLCNWSSQIFLLQYLLFQWNCFLTQTSWLLLHFLYDIFTLKNHVEKPGNVPFFFFSAQRISFLSYFIYSGGLNLQSCSETVLFYTSIWRKLYQMEIVPLTEIANYAIGNFI